MLSQYRRKQGVIFQEPEMHREHLSCFVFQFDFVELLDGRRLLTQEARSLEGPQRQHRGFVPMSSHETGFIQYLDSGIWHLAFYNDGKESEVVSFLTTAIGKDLRHFCV